MSDEMILKWNCALNNGIVGIGQDFSSSEEKIACATGWGDRMTGHCCSTIFGM